MSPGVKKAARWLVIMCLGGYGLYLLAIRIWILTASADGHWSAVNYFLLACSGLFLAAACLLWRQDYRHLCTLASAVVSFLVFFILLSVPKSLGLNERLDSWEDSGWARSISVLLQLASVIMALEGAHWVWRRMLACLALTLPGACHRSGSENPRKPLA